MQKKRKKERNGYWAYGIMLANVVSAWWWWMMVVVVDDGGGGGECLTILLKWR